MVLAIAADALHLLAAGGWAGALVPLVLFLRWARAGGPAAPPPIAVAVAVRRFSTLALLSVVVMLASGAYAVPLQVGSVPALLGTAYGRWLLIKLALLVPLLGVAFVNRAYYRPRLERAAVEPTDGGSDAGALVARLGRCVLIEALLMVAVFGTVAMLGLTTPARHDPIDWPLPFRFAWATTSDLPACGRAWPSAARSWF
ncbi:MAG: copper resistance D family protein [Candidatus Rokuibacteriota bacterium]